jgi:hypothetical protein
MILQKGVTFTQIVDFIELRMDFNWTPFEQMRTGDSSSIKSGVLSDIKWDKRRIKKSLKQLISINFT